MLPYPCGASPGVSGVMASSTWPSSDPHAMRRQRLCSRCSEYAAVAHIKRGAVQRADQPYAAQSAFAQARVCVRADVIECVQAVFAVADHEFTAIDCAGPQAAGRQGFQAKGCLPVFRHH